MNTDLRKFEPNINKDSSDEQDDDLEAYNNKNLNQDLPLYDEGMNNEYSNIEEEDQFTYDTVSPKITSSREKNMATLHIGESGSKNRSHQNTFHSSSLQSGIK